MQVNHNRFLGYMKDEEGQLIIKPKEAEVTLEKILQNEKYIGDALLQKTVTVDFFTKNRTKNNDIVPQYYMENSHGSVILRDLYMQVQEMMVRRANLHSGQKEYGDVVEEIHKLREYSQDVLTQDAERDGRR